MAFESDTILAKKKIAIAITMLNMVGTELKGELLVEVDQRYVFTLSVWIDLETPAEVVVRGCRRPGDTRDLPFNR